MSSTRVLGARRGKPRVRASDAASAAAPDESRHHPPPQRPGLVSRRRLVQRLAADPSTRVAALIAPAGYGKTTVLTEWAATDERPFAWITVDHADNDPARLLRAVASALGALQPEGPGGEQPTLALPPRFSEAALTRLGRYLQQQPRSFVLVMDDIHSLESSQALAVLTTIAEHLPDGSQLALGARSEPQLPLGRMRAHHSVAEVRVPDLAMTRAETAQLLAANEIELKDGHVATLVDRTEGWPAALYLAVLALRDQADPNRAAARFAGDDRIVADYLRDELLSNVSPRRLRFLMRTSILDRLTGPLCDAVLDRSGSGPVLQAMSRSNLLLIPMDRGDEWYRYHTLLAEGLRGELHRREPELEADLHRRASAWFAEHDDSDRAIEHAVAAQDGELAGELMWANVPRYLPNGQVMTVRRWISRLPEEEIGRNAPLALTAGYCALNLGNGDLAEHWGSAASQVLERVPAARRRPELEAGAAMLRACMARAGAARMREDAARATELLDPDSPWRSFSCMLDGVARHLVGDRVVARQRLDEGARRAAAANVPDIEALCLAQLALLGADDRAAPDDEAIRAASRTERAGLAEFPDMALVFAAAADTRTRRGDVEGGARDLKRTQLLLAMLGDDFAAWLQIEARLLAARAALALTDVRVARKLLVEAQRLMRRLPDAPVLVELRDELLARADAMADSSLPGSVALTTAELKVLRLLPTHYSFAEMAERLYVSPNTVKTQAHAVYRKLDASSRSEAVDRARALGLLEDPEVG